MLKRVFPSDTWAENSIQCAHRTAVAGTYNDVAENTGTFALRSVRWQ